MKKSLWTVAICFAALTSVNAQQKSKNAIGLRFGNSSGLGTEISYQRNFSDSNRLELDFGWKSRHDIDAIKLTGTYQWVWNIDKGFNWFAGPGLGVGTWNSSYRIDKKKYSDNGTFALITGSVGIEYNFDFPLQIALDVRPEIYLNDTYRDGLYTDVGIAVRYKF